MNIFFIDSDPFKAARWHGDKHVVKMILESAQMMSTAHHVTGSEHAENLYKPVHINHPCSIWVRENLANYEWMWNLFCGLCGEFRLRRGKSHATSRLLITLSCDPNLPESPVHTRPVLAMPGEFKTNDPVESYRNYYRHKHECGIVEYNWMAERKPDWLQGA